MTPPPSTYPKQLPLQHMAQAWERSVRHFKEQIRRLTRRKAPLKTQELIEQVNPVVRGWGQHYKRAHVRKLFNRLDRWVVRRIWSHRLKRWRCCGWNTLPRSKLYGEFGLRCV